MNRAIIYGRLGADPTIRETKAGPVMSCRVASTEREKRGDEWIDRVEWHGVVMWGKRGEAIGRLLTKGSAVIVEGSLRTSSWEKDGQKRERTEIVAANITLAGPNPAASPNRNTLTPTSDEPDWQPDNDLPF